MWVLVCGGFHRRGGMDRANAALAAFLSERGDTIHLVAHEVDEDLERFRGVSVTRVRRPAGSSFAGELALATAARRVAQRLRRLGTRLVIIGNGGNCARADVNWVHSVHHVWPSADDGAPSWFRLKNRIYKLWARARERRAVGAARLVIANSERTRQDVIDTLGVAPGRVRTVYLGSDASWTPPSSTQRQAARRRWCRIADQPLVVFVGALGHDVNKGIDVLIAAWNQLERGGWRGDLLVAGAGDIRRWRAAAKPAVNSIRFLGHIPEVGELLNAADVIVSPVRYEAYGLAIHEAVARGVPAIVSRDAGVVERLPPSLGPLLLPAKPEAADVAARLQTWAADRDGWREKTRVAAHRLNAYSERDMAAQIVGLARGTT